MSTKKQSKTEGSLFKKAGVSQSTLFECQHMDVGSKREVPYRPMRFNEEVKVLQDYIKNLEKEQKHLLVSEQLLCHFSKKLEKIQDIRSEEFWYFCEELGIAGEKIKKALNLSSPKADKKADAGQVSLEEILESWKK